MSSLLQDQSKRKDVIQMILAGVDLLCLLDVLQVDYGKFFDACISINPNPCFVRVSDRTAQLPSGKMRLAFETLLAIENTH